MHHPHNYYLVVMGQIFSSVWRCIRSKFRNETKTPVDDPLHEQPSHYISIPDAEVQHVSSSIPDLGNAVLVFDPLHDEQPSHYISIPDAEVEHVSSSIPENVTDLTPDHDVPSVVVNLGNVVQKEDNNNNKEEVDGEKSIRVVEEEKYVDENKATYKVYDQLINIEIRIKRIGLYTSKQKILLVGEGDFSFSACLAVAFASASNIVATSLDSQEFLMKNYKKFMMNKANVESRGGVIMHGVNVKKMNKDAVLGCLKFDRIIYNFPHTGDFGRTQTDLRNSKELVRGFIRNAKKMINDDGEIHIRHKTNGFFHQWDIPKIGSDQGLFLIRKSKFYRSEYPGYHTKYGFGGDKDFDCTPSRTYIFGLP